MMEDLFKNNKFVYIHIKTHEYANIIESMTISLNIENLRYLYVDNDYKRLDITLDVYN